MIRLEEVCFSVGDFSLEDVGLIVGPGEYFVLIGRPGSGKTLLLECIAGLQQIAGGTIDIGGQRVDALEPAERGVGYVPQDYALFSRRSVAANIELGLRVRGWPRRDRMDRVQDVAELLGIEHLLGRGTPGLSGGERQRVALARALAILPSVLLLDEPVNALDPETRDDILAELRRVHDATGTTTIHVCHDLDEMRAVADRVGVMHEGRLVQAGTPDMLAEAPVSSAVVRLLRLGTVLQGEARPDGDGAQVDLGGFRVTARGGFKTPTTGPVGSGDPTYRGLETTSSGRVAGPVEVLIRADRLRVGEGELEGEVVSVLRRDSGLRLEIRVGGVVLRAVTQTASGLGVGSRVRVGVPEEAVYVF